MIRPSWAALCVGRRRHLLPALHARGDHPARAAHRAGNAWRSSYGQSAPAWRSFGVGAGITHVTGRSPSGCRALRQLAFGMVAAAITFGIGSLIGNVIP